MTELPPGIKRTATGYRSFQWVPDPTRPQGRMKSKRWKHDATVKQMVQWQEERRVEARQPKPIANAPVALTGFPVDALLYLQTVRAMPTIKNRERDISEWIAVLGQTPSLEIRSQQIRAARDQWLTIGPKRVQEKVPDGKPRWVPKRIPLSPFAVNHRLRALENFFTVMYPKAANPVREVDEAQEPDAQPRGQTFALALEILAHMPDVTSPKKGGVAEKGSLSRARFEAMLWTGLPAIQLARLTPALVDWQGGTFTVPRRQKGRRSRRARPSRPAKPRPLLPQALAALTRLFAVKGNCRFFSSSISRSVKRAMRAANRVREANGLPLIPLSLQIKDLTRHTFGTEAQRASGNLKATQELLDHHDIRQTERYAAAAVAEQTVLAIQQLAAAQTPRPPQRSTVARHRKRLKSAHAQIRKHSRTSR